MYFDHLLPLFSSPYRSVLPPYPPNFKFSKKPNRTSKVPKTKKIK